MRNHKLLPILFTVLFFVLTACQPKGTTLYQNPNPERYPMNRMVVVIDYLNLRDDVGRYWDFDSYYHQKVMNQLLNQVTDQLHSANYPPIDAYLLSSGLLIKHDFAVEHYINEVLQPDLLHPPFVLAQQNISTQHLADHQEFLGLLVKYIAQRRHHESDDRSLRGMQMGYHFESMDLPADSGILYMHVDLSAAGAIKQLGSFLIAGALASQSDYAAVHIDGGYKRHASAFLLHKGTGQILWKNHSTSWTPEQPLGQLLSSFPGRD